MFRLAVRDIQLDNGLQETRAWECGLRRWGGGILRKDVMGVKDGVWIWSGGGGGLERGDG